MKEEFEQLITAKVISFTHSQPMKPNALILTGKHVKIMQLEKAVAFWGLKIYRSTDPNQKEPLVGFVN